MRRTTQRSRTKKCLFPLTRAWSLGTRPRTHEADGSSVRSLSEPRSTPPRAQTPPDTHMVLHHHNTSHLTPQCNKCYIFVDIQLVIYRLYIVNLRLFIDTTDWLCEPKLLLYNFVNKGFGMRKVQI